MEATKVAIVLVLVLVVVSVAGVMMVNQVDSGSNSVSLNMGARQAISIQRPAATGQAIQIVRSSENGGVQR